MTQAPLDQESIGTHVGLSPEADVRPWVGRAASLVGAGGSAAAAVGGRAAIGLERGQRATLGLCIEAAVAVGLSGQDGVEAWCASAARELRTLFIKLRAEQPGARGGPVGAWAAVVGGLAGPSHAGSGAGTPSAAAPGGPEVLALSVDGYAGFSPEQMYDLASSVASSAGLWAANRAAQVRGPGISGEPRGMLMVTEPTGSDEAARVTTPLGRFVRAAQGLPWGSPAGAKTFGGRGLVWQVDGRAGVWVPGAAEVDAAELMNAALLRAFELGVVRPEGLRAALMARLSRSQAPIVPLLAQGLNQRQIGEQIGRSLHTVHDHVKGIYAALGVKSRHELNVLWNGGDVSKAGNAED